MDRKIKGYWSFDKVREEALRFTKRSDFNKLSKSAYLAAYRNGWLDDVCSHMRDKRKSKDEFEKLINDMKVTINII